jgi:sialate O-acetylesterase
MRKIAVIQCILFMAGSMAACGGPESTSAPTETPRIEITETTRAVTPSPVPERVVLSLAPVFTKNAVLQRDAPVPVFGGGTEGAVVTVGFGGQEKQGRVVDGRWEVVLDPMKGTFSEKTLTVTCGGEILTVKGVVVGEVWYAGGQSNMSWRVNDMTDETVRAQVLGMANEKVRIYQSFPMPSDKKTINMKRFPWLSGRVENIGSMSAIAYVFANHIQNELGVPVGMICTALTGTYIEQWLDEDFMDESGLSKLKGVRTHELNYYNGTVFQLAGYRFAGVIWYQGENNVTNVHEMETYHAMFDQFAAQTRRDFNNPVLPIITVQLPVFDFADYDLWPDMRLLQAEAAAEDPNTYLTVTIDHGEAGSIHPSDKIPIAQSMGNLALKHVYGQKDIAADFPTYESHAINGNKATVVFKNVDQGLVVKGSHIAGFEVAGSDGKFVGAEATIGSDGKSVVVSAPGVPEIIDIRYGNYYYLEVTLFDKNGLPVAPFTTKMRVVSRFPLED